MTDSHAAMAEEIARLRAERSAPTRREADIEAALREVVRDLGDALHNGWSNAGALDGYERACALCGLDPATGKPVR